MTDKQNKEKRKLILIADDDSDVLNQLQFYLESWGYETRLAENQKQAQEQLDIMKPDLAIYDLMMENHDSGFVLSYLTKKKFPDVPVILVTGVSAEAGFHFDATTSETRSWIKADVVMDKDIRYEQLKAEIEHLLQG